MDSGPPQYGDGSPFGKKRKKKKERIKLHTVARKNAFLLSERKRKEWPIHGRARIKSWRKTVQVYDTAAVSQKALLGIHCTFSSKVP